MKIKLAVSSSGLARWSNGPWETVRSKKARRKLTQLIACVPFLVAPSWSFGCVAGRVRLFPGGVRSVRFLEG